MQAIWQSKDLDTQRIIAVVTATEDPTAIGDANYEDVSLCLLAYSAHALGLVFCEIA